ncbi:hypothetical protein LCGC14_2258620 [marine sediment metagenome]|uniref:Uncharacterized protein n=1 Tax=marine sediment metagenome TaxID=412755 RepID=A0A0F9FCV6_9ZZZZ
MLLKIENCCTRFKMITKKILLNPLIDTNSTFHIIVYIDTVAIWYCPYCGLEVKIRLVE